jgi:WhiB family redox-sensing transcriptional regulator
VTDLGQATNWPANLEEFWDWHVEAACRDLGDELFYSPEGERGPRKHRREALAKAICGACGVRELCAAYALATREPYGTWGGLSESERRELRVDAGQAAGAYRVALARWGMRGRVEGGRA